MSFPVVPLESIPTHGLTVDIGDWARAACGEGLGGTTTRVGGRIEIVRTGRRIAVRGALEGAATVVCDRCGEPLPLVAAGEVDCLYLPVDEIAAAPVDGEELEEAPEHGEYDGVALDLAHVVREFFALERPVRVLCADADPTADAACHARFRARAVTKPADGLVARPGDDVGPPAPDPRLAALKGVKPTH